MRVTKQIKERLENGLDVLLRKEDKEWFIFKDDECWTIDIIVDGETQVTNFFDNIEDLIYEIKNYF